MPQVKPAMWLRIKLTDSSNHFTEFRQVVRNHILIKH